MSLLVARLYSGLMSPGDSFYELGGSMLRNFRVSNSLGPLLWLGSRTGRLCRWQPPFFGIFYGSFMGMVCHQQSKNLLELEYEEVVIYIIQKKKIKKWSGKEHARRHVPYSMEDSTAVAAAPDTLERDGLVSKAVSKDGFRWLNIRIIRIRIRLKH